MEGEARSYRQGLLGRLRRRGLRGRLLGLLGLVVIVGAAMGIMAAAGLLGNQGGGTTESGVAIEGALVLEPPPPPGVSDYQVGVKVGQAAKDFEASDFQGQRIRLSHFRGRPVYINLWASWCIPCRAEMPDIRELMDRHPELVTIGVNRAEPLKRAQGFLEGIELKGGSRGMSFTVDALDPDDSLYDAYRALGMPVSIFVDVDGFITFVRNGRLLQAEMEEALALTVASPATAGR